MAVDGVGVVPGLATLRCQVGRWSRHARDDVSRLGRRGLGSRTEPLRPAQRTRTTSRKVLTTSTFRPHYGSVGPALVAEERRGAATDRGTGAGSARSAHAFHRRVGVRLGRCGRVRAVERLLAENFERRSELREPGEVVSAPSRRATSTPGCGSSSTSASSRGLAKPGPGDSGGTDVSETERFAAVR